MPYTTDPDQIQHFVDMQTEAVRPLLSLLRHTLKEVVPQATEQFHTGWKVLTYKNKRVVCSLAPHAKWVNIQFMEGTSLKDPASLLQGTGKTMRHVKITAEQDVSESVIAIITQAEQRSH